MNMYTLAKRVQKASNKAIMDSLERDHLLIRDDGVYVSKNDEVVIDCFMEATIGRIQEYSKPLEEVESWRSKLDPADKKGTADHIKAGKALKYTISCLKKGKDPDPEKIFKVGGFMEEGSGNE